MRDEVYAPFGDDPLLLHDVTIRNTSDRSREVSWFEYWDVNPRVQPSTARAQPRHRGAALGRRASARSA